MRDHLSVQELRGPRNITSSNVDRIFDDNGQRFLIIEEKGSSEKVAKGQTRLLRNLAASEQITVWGVRGTPDELEVWRLTADGKQLVAAGNWDDYQRAVMEWFTGDRGDDEPSNDLNIVDRQWEDVVRIITEAPFEKPSWMTDETHGLWDGYTTRLAVERGT